MAKIKWQWAGHVARLDRERWAHSAGCPQKSWVDDIREGAGYRWVYIAQTRETSKGDLRMGETYIQ